ncbi:MAG: hypothetical protein DME54_04195 [Verrucomicrobia bacterium]|nr:MAG: hypothetical protein DME54_04195 [Verrucomicrobiota bacterium]
MNEQNRTYRDEQFWFTVAVVAFNTALFGKDVASIPRCARVVASVIISVLGAIIILTRWVASARKHADDVRREQKGIESPPRSEGRFRDLPAEAPNPEFSPASLRFSYFLAELRAGIRSLPYIAAEGSGSLYFLIAIILTSLGVLLYA